MVYCGDNYPLVFLPAKVYTVRMLTIAQIYAIVNLILAFGGTPEQGKVVENILLNSQKTVIFSPAPAVGGEIPSEVPRATLPYVQLLVNGQAGPVTLTKTGCITSGVKTCATAQISWKSEGVTGLGCGISGTTDWAGNHGTNGALPATIHNDTIVTIQCETGGGKISDSVEVYLK